MQTRDEGDALERRDETAEARPDSGAVAQEAVATDASHLEEAGEASPYDDLVAKLVTGTIDVPELAQAIEHQEAADAADTLEALQEDKAAELLVEMEAQSAAAALAEMEKPLAVGVLEDLIDEGETAYAAKLMQAMAPDDAVDVLQATPEQYREALLLAMPPLVAARLRRLFAYDKESAGGIMTTDFTAVRDEMTVAEATDVVRRRDIPEAVQDLPVLNGEDVLVGIIGLRDLLIHKPHERIADFMQKRVDALRPEMDREAVARDFARYDYSMMPVVGPAGALLGIVTIDDVIDIIQAEQTEDVQKTVGAGAGEAVYSKVSQKFKGRFPWLGASLVMTCIAAAVILLFADLIEEKPILAFLMPVIAALVGNAGHQALAVTLRGIVLDEVRPDRVWPLIVREAATGLLNGVVLGMLIVVGMAVLGNWVSGASWQMGAIAGSAAAVAMCIGTFTGACIPILMKKLGADPAAASAIFLIMITDAVSFVSLLTLTMTLLEA